MCGEVIATPRSAPPRQRRRSEMAVVAVLQRCEISGNRSTALAVVEWGQVKWYRMQLTSTRVLEYMSTCSPRWRDLEEA